MLVEIAVAAAAAAALLALTVGLSGMLTGASALLVPVGVVGCGLLACSSRSEIGLAVVLLYIGLLDGYLKLSTGIEAISVVRDLLLYAVVAGIVVRSVVAGDPLTAPRFGLHILLFAAIVAAQALNPSTPGARAALGGLRQHLEFVPLFMLGYLVMRSQRRLAWFLTALIGVIVLNAVVAAVQYALSPEQLAAWGPGYAERILGTGDFVGGGRTFADASGASRVRPFGLGSDLGAAGTLGSLGIAGALALVAVGPGKGLRVWGALGALACLLAVLTAQSRLAILSGGFAVLCFFAISVSSREAVRLVVTLATGAAIAFFAISSFVGENDSDGLSRYQTLAPSQIGATIATDRGGSLALVPSMATGYPLGAGLGRAGPASGFGGANSGLNAENEFNLLIGEVGTVGMLVLLWLWVRVIAAGVVLVRGERDSRTRFLSAGIVTPVVVMFVAWFAAAPTTNTPSAPLFWLAAGMIAWASRAGADPFKTAAVSRPGACVRPFREA